MRGSNSGILLCLALRAALQPRPAGAQAPASEQCDTATFSIQAGSVDEACCDGVTNCPDGVPEQCNAACAEVFSVFYDRCHDMLSAQFSPTEMASYDQFYSTCSSNSSGRPEDICSTPHQVQEVARQVTTTCQGTQGATASGGLSLPAHCAADCAAVFLPWFGDGHGSCFAALHLDEMTVQVFASFAESCRGENSGVDMSGAIFVPPSGGSPESMLLCFDASCGAAPVLEQRGAVVLEGCVAGGSLGAVCRLGCRAGYTMASAQDGQCTLSEVGTVAIYSGQTVACSPVREALDSLMRSLPLRFCPPSNSSRLTRSCMGVCQETEPNGQMSAAYCQMAAAEAMLDCCELEHTEGVVCSAATPPATCVVECAELWEPLVEECGPHLQDFQQLTAECVRFPRFHVSETCARLVLKGRRCVLGARWSRTRSWPERPRRSRWRACGAWGTRTACTRLRTGRSEASLIGC